jgi:perosamine synthetase
MEIKVPLCRPDVGDLELHAIADAFRSGSVSHGTYIHEFEELFAKLVGAKYAIAMNSWTSAAFLVFQYIREFYGAGEVILPSFSFVASANVVSNSGLLPKFADISENSYEITYDTIRPLINKNTRAIMPVHFAGKPVDLSAINELIKNENILLVEDSAESIGVSTIDGVNVGSCGVGIFSFYATKNMTTGEGGMVTTSDPILAKWLRIQMAHGIEKESFFRNGITQPWYRNSTSFGHNFRMTNFQAAMGIVQLGKLDKMNECRHEIAATYFDALSGRADLFLDPILSKENHSYQMFVLRTFPEIRDKVVNLLNENGVGASVHFDPPIHLQTAYATYRVQLPFTEKASNCSISLPISSVQSKKETNYVIKTLIETLEVLI